MNHKSRSILIGLICFIATLGLAVGGYLLFQNRPSTTTPEVSQPEPAGPPYNFDYSWTEYPYIAHAMGGILGNNYTNSREAFILNYQLGQRVFEADFDITTDGRTVLTHDADAWRINTVPKFNTEDSTLDPKAFTYDNFMSSLWYDKYHTIDVDGVFQLLQEHPDAYIITDTKYFDEERVTLQFSEIINAAKKYDAKLLDRLIIQIYRPEMLELVMNLYPWKSIIYTLYSNPDWTPENVLAFAKESGVKFITIWGSLVERETIDLWDAAKIKVGAHTINSLAEANRLRSLGVSVIYTDFLLP